MILTLILGVVYFYLGLFAPLFSFVFPFFMINQKKKFKNSYIKFNIYTYILILLLSFTAKEDKIIVVIFVVNYVIIQIVYFFINKINNFEKIFLSSVLSSFNFLIFYLIQKDFFDKNLKLLQEVYINYFKLNQQEVINYFKFFKSNSLYIIFIYMFLNVLILYFLINKKYFSNIKFKYYYLIFFIISIIYLKYIGYNYILNNLLQIIQFTYMIYGVYKAYSILKIKNRFMSLSIVIMIFLISPFIYFLFGAFESFDLNIFNKKKV
ncbi:hypothetical protein EV215_0863 [Hypnocyclicus thermotrophus]|uniref:Uncharacterized protein n=1 Tax=Hypnocyclicus thermotrophus TaxID=1627895 RepID=A0AA46I6C0_9FUSO|nr:O-antigen polymerase [Hypnocyclicus thermotrophus]TDT71487.1 hypothetical protein EV215_0863 [Hypnocyclicus thermotrophus]